MLKKFILAAVMVLGLGVFGAASASAFSITSEERAYMGPDQIVDGTMYTSGSTVQVAGTVNGDLFCAGQTVEITGTVNGDVICAAQQLKVGGTVNGDVRVAGQLVSVEGSVSGSLTAFGQTVQLSSAGSVGRDATVMGQTVTLDGSIGRELVGGGTMVTLNGPVGGDVKLEVRSLTLGSSAAVAGSLNYTSPKDATVQQGASTGTVVRTDPPKDTTKEVQTSLAGMVATAFYWFLAMMLIGLAVMAVKPQALVATAEHIRQEPWPVLGWGLVATFITPIVALLVALTVVGIPLMLVLLLVWLAVLIASTVFSGHALGRLIITQGGTKMSEGWLRFASLALGLLILGVVSLIPFVNALAGCVAVLFGTGSLLYLLRNKSAVAAKRGKT